jgi:hypothetical protein
LSERYGVNPKTVIKWKKRDFVHDTLVGPKDVRSRVPFKGEGGSPHRRLLGASTALAIIWAVVEQFTILAA